MDQTQLSFRRATRNDVDAFLGLERSVATNKTYSGILDHDEALREIAENEVYLIYLGEQLVGNTEFQMRATDHAYMAGLAIHPAYQGQGIGRAAIKFRLDKVKNVRRVGVLTHPENVRMLRLYTSFGFKIVGRIENCYGDGEPRYVLARIRSS